MNDEPIDVCKAVLEWASSAGTHGCNPYTLKMVIFAERAVAKSECREPESWATCLYDMKIVGDM